MITREENSRRDGDAPMKSVKIRKLRIGFEINSLSIATSGSRLVDLAVLGKSRCFIAERVEIEKVMQKGDRSWLCRLALQEKT